MKINKMSKITTTIIIILTSLIINIENCYAGAIPGISIGSSGNDNGGDNDLPKKELDDGEVKEINGKYYAWSYEYWITGSSNFTANAYDVDGDSVMPKGIEIDESKYTYSSGTWLGINVTKINTTSWGVQKFEYQEVKTQYTCKYKRPGASWTCKGAQKKLDNVFEKNCTNKYESTFYPTERGRGTCVYYEKKTCSRATDTKTYIKKVTYGAKNPCPDDHPNDYRYIYDSETHKTIYESSTNSAAGKKLKADAIKKIHDDAVNLILGKKGIVQYNPDNGEEPLEITNGKLSKEDEIGPIETSSGGYGTITKEYEFLEEKVCINVKTSEVAYKRDCKANEIRIKNGTTNNGVRYWHYFSPLKAKTGFNQTLIVKEAKYSIKYLYNDCKNTIENKTNRRIYHKHIIGISKNEEEIPLIGDYYIEKNGKLYENKSSEDKKNIKNGCRQATTIHFPVTQQFYKEIKDEGGNIKFKGFNFYYKPIDINEPFPNGLSSTSIWNEWNKTGRKNPNLLQSFVKSNGANITYTTKNLSANAIASIDTDISKNYKSDDTGIDYNPNLNWTGMDKDGSSQFIDKNSIIIREKGGNNFYKLGCGPANKKQYLDERKKIKNPRYIEGCDKQ